MEKIRMIRQHELDRLKLDSRVQFYSTPRADLIAHTRVETSDLSKYADDNEPKRFVPVDVLVDVTRVSGNPVILRTVADLCGFDLVAKYEDAPQASASTDESMLIATAEFGDVAREYFEAKRDGKLDALDKQRIRREGQQAVAAILAFLNTL